MKRAHQILLIVTFLPLCWLGMMAVHELGHVLAAWGTGGAVVKVVLHPFAISQTHVVPNPKPHIVVWAGPLVGVLFPLAVWAASQWARIGGAYLLRFFAGFCLIANGAYIGIGSLDRIGDAGEMIQYGTPLPLLWLFGSIAFVTGLALWHGLGPHFGLGKSRGAVETWAAYLSLSTLVLTLVLTFLLSPRS